jgi:hypothetical protein
MSSHKTDSVRRIFSELGIGEQARRNFGDGAPAAEFPKTENEAIPKDAETLRIEALAERIKVRHFKEITLSKECRHLVYNLIPRRGLVVVWGPPKCGKTFWVYDLKMHISRGLKYRGKDVVQGAVVYCMFEGQGGADTRAEAYRQEILKNKDDPGPFFDVTLPLDLIRDHPALIMAIKRQLGDVKPVAITLDTLNRSLFGSEASDEDMAAYIRAAGVIIDAFDCAVIVIHHCGHNADRPRGHSALLGAEDAEIAVKRLADDKTIVAEVIRMKDGPEGERVPFMLRTVTVGQDERGNNMTSCVVEPCETDLPTPSRGKRGKKAEVTWTKSMRVVQKAVAEAIIQAGMRHRVMGDGPMVNACLLQEARNIHKQKFVGDGDYDDYDSQEEADKARKAAERQSWGRHLKTAREGDLVGVENVEAVGELVWFAKEGK